MTETQAATEPYPCPVCFSAMDTPPEDHAICSNCGTHFAYDDCGRTHEELRALWIAHGCRWHYLEAAIKREKQAAATDLKPCPFCGHAAESRVSGIDCDPPVFWVECGAAVRENYWCIAGPQRLTPEEARAAWNTRALGEG